MGADLAQVPETCQGQETGSEGAESSCGASWGLSREAGKQGLGLGLRMRLGWGWGRGWGCCGLPAVGRALLRPWAPLLSSPAGLQRPPPPQAEPVLPDLNPGCSCH